MKLKDIEKKNTFWYQYGGRIKPVVMIITKFLLGLVCILVCFKIFQYLYDEGMVTNFLKALQGVIMGFLQILNILVEKGVMKGITIAIWILYASVVIYKKIVFYIHQQYIPLTKEELYKNNITTMEEYDVYLKKYLNNFEPVEKIKEMIYFNTFRYLYTPEQQLEYMKRRYIDLPESVEELIKKIMDYDLDYDVHKDDKFVTDLICRPVKHYRVQVFEGFYFDSSYRGNCFDGFIIYTVILLICILVLSVVNEW